MDRALTSASEVIDALGGTTATSRITGRKGLTPVYNWRATGRLPADTFLVLQAKLAERGYTAPPALWGIVEPERRTS